VILDEYRYAQELLRERQEKLQNKDLIILAKFWRAEGLKPSKIKRNLLEYCQKTDKYGSEFFWNKKIKWVFNESRKYRVQRPVNIYITEEELKSIKSVNDYQKEKILFVLLAFAKFKKHGNFKVSPSKRPRKLGLFYASLSPRDIFDLARVNVRKQKRFQILKELGDSGFIRQKSYTNRKGWSYGTVLLNYANEESPVGIALEDCDNFVLYYQRFCGEKVAGCSCGKLYLKKTSRHNLCPACWSMKRKEKKREWDKNNKTSGQNPPS
jgi:hypothetical protein